MADLKRALRAVGIIQGRKGEVLSFLFFLSDKKKKVFPEASYKLLPKVSFSWGRASYKGG